MPTTTRRRSAGSRRRWARVHACRRRWRPDRGPTAGTRGGVMLWRCRDVSFELDARALVMGVVNITPDSFSDGGRFLSPQAALARARQLLAEGADLLDLGAESTRPGSRPVPPEEQWHRLAPVLEQLSNQAETVVSVDTASASVAERALEAGARVVNDVTALGDPSMAGLVASAGAGVVLTHMRGTPADMQRDPRYDDVAREVADPLTRRVEAARAGGIEDRQLALDPGIGFGKTTRHNLELLARLETLADLGRPVLVGVSRKSVIGRVLDLPVDQRLEGGLAAA